MSECKIIFLMGLFEDVLAELGAQVYRKNSGESGVSWNLLDVNGRVVVFTSELVEFAGANGNIEQLQTCFDGVRAFEGVLKMINYQHSPENSANFDAMFGPLYARIQLLERMAEATMRMWRLIMILLGLFCVILSVFLGPWGHFLHDGVV